MDDPRSRRRQRLDLMRRIALDQPRHPRLHVAGHDARPAAGPRMSDRCADGCGSRSCTGRMGARVEHRARLPHAAAESPCQPRGRRSHRARGWLFGGRATAGRRSSERSVWRARGRRCRGTWPAIGRRASWRCLPCRLSRLGGDRPPRREGLSAAEASSCSCTFSQLITSLRQ